MTDYDLNQIKHQIIITEMVPIIGKIKLQTRIDTRNRNLFKDPKMEKVSLIIIGTIQKALDSISDNVIDIFQLGKKIVDIVIAQAVIEVMIADSDYFDVSDWVFQQYYNKLFVEHKIETILIPSVEVIKHMMMKIQNNERETRRLYQELHATMRFQDAIRRLETNLYETNMRVDGLVYKFE